MMSWFRFFFLDFVCTKLNIHERKIELVDFDEFWDFLRIRFTFRIVAL